MSESELRVEREFLKINKLAEGHELIKARGRCERLYREFPEIPRVLQGMGLLLFRTGDREEGERLINRAIQLKPDYADAYHNLGNIKRLAHQHEEAERMYRRAIDLDPGNFKALAWIGWLLNDQKRSMEAIGYCERALMINPKHAHAYGVLGSVMSGIGKPGEAVRYLRKAIGRGRNNAAHSSLLFNLNIPPETEQKEIFMESARWGKIHCSHLTRKARPHLNTPLHDRRLRIGYVSGDFKKHPVAFHLLPVLASHDKSKVEIYLYDNFPQYTDEMTDALAARADYYRDISYMPDEKAENIIRRDGIDILVDLSGHTSYHRLHLFARKPAPVQVSWLGYFNTTGLAAIDYLLSDAVTIPPGGEELYVEEVVRLPHCRFCYSPPDYAPEVAPLPALQAGHVTFGSFNKIAKMNEQVIALWSRVLQLVPGSRLLLKWSLLKEKEMGDELKARFAHNGIDEERLILRPDTPHPEMLAEYGDVDISLDTFPYNGGATTCESLWMGVPVVTLMGRIPIGRQSTAFLRTIGCGGWVAKSTDEYVEIAVQLASDITTLSSIRGTLRQKMAESPLCDGKGFTSSLEGLYRQMWERWCLDRGLSEVSPDTVRRFSAEELFDAGANAMKDNDYLRASQLFQYVIKRDSHHARARNNLGISLFMTGNGREAIKSFRLAIRHDKVFVDAYSNLGRSLLEMGESGKALKVCRRAITIKPDHLDALIHLSNTCRERGRIGEARVHLERALELEPENVRVLRLLAIIMQGYGNASKGIELLRRALEIAPADLEVVSTLMMIMQYDLATEQDNLLDCGRRYGKIVEGRFPCPNGKFAPSGAKERLKVGFVSADFSNHPVGTLLTALFSRYEPARLSLYCYNNGRRRDSLTEWYSTRATGWRDIFALNDSEAADLIRKDEIDILIDLAGHTDGNRLPLFSKRPAPLQASWMGFGHTTGLSTMDYFIADKDMIQEEDEQWFTEKVVRLPYSRFCFTPTPNCPEVVDPPFEYNGHITFGCFNNIAKVSSGVIEAWARILKMVPRSRMIIKWKSLKDPGLRRHIGELFSGFGVSKRRVEFRTESNRYLMMLEYGDVDIALDPFPFTGGITSLNALWMGVPVVTMGGSLPISRQTLSFLRLIGLPELVAHGEEEYIALAAKLASDQDRLRNIRASLRNMMLNSPLCDEKGFAESVQDLFFSIWREALMNAEIRLP
jgi:predicted O-linked N-acetylglucosamine transferase (SPINDLY family)